MIEHANINIWKYSRFPHDLFLSVRTGVLSAFVEFY